MNCLSLLAQSITYHSHIIFQLLQSNFTFLQRLQGAPAEEEKLHPHHPQNGHLSWSVSAIWAPQPASMATGLDAKQRISGTAGKTDRKSYRFEGSVRISKRLFILLRSFFLSEIVWETETLTTRTASILADRNKTYCQKMKTWANTKESCED